MDPGRLSEPLDEFDAADCGAVSRPACVCHSDCEQMAAAGQGPQPDAALEPIFGQPGGGGAGLVRTGGAARAEPLGGWGSALDYRRQSGGIWPSVADRGTGVSPASHTAGVELEEGPARPQFGRETTGVAAVGAGAPAGRQPGAA